VRHGLHNVTTSIGSTSYFTNCIMLRSLYIDLNSYFASVEQEVHPELRGRPVAVVPVMADTTCAIAASYEAKRFGVKTGTMIAEAKRMCPDLVLVQARHALYVEYHHKIVDCVERVIHVKRVNSIDEMVCDLTGSARAEEQALRIAAEVKQAIRTDVGDSLRCSIGIAPNDYLAKTASDMQKPDGLVVLREHDLPQRLYELELRDLCGIGKKMYERCWKHGVYTVEMLCNATEQQLRDIWGSIEGERMYARLRGQDVPYTETQKSTVGHSHVLEPILRTREGACGVLHRLLQKAAMRLRQYGLTTGQLALRLRYVDGRRWKDERDITPTQDVVQLTAIMSSMLDHLPPDGTPLKVSLALNRVAPFEAIPQPMFDNVGPARSALNDSLDAINKKYGKNTVYLGPAWNALSSAPMRIAFNHIPDLEVDDDE
jgi:DNA polymerase-4